MSLGGEPRQNMARAYALYTESPSLISNLAARLTVLNAVPLRRAALKHQWEKKFKKSYRNAECQTQ